jgi:uncharacterized protein
MEDAQMTRRALQFVTKISKYCNLRCTYCYEFNELADPTRMSLDQLRAMFSTIQRYVQTHDIATVSFVWHGGEPLLIKRAYYEEIGRLQREIFGDTFDVRNSVQTNLTALPDDMLDFLASGSFFRGIGVSFDVYGEERVDMKGRSSTDRVLDNMQRLVDADISFGAISVLSRTTLKRATDIFRFFESIGVDFRFLPFYRSANPDQIEAHAISGEEITTAFSEVFDLWLTSERPIAADPVDQHINDALAVIAGEDVEPYAKFEDEDVLLVNTNGDVWGVSETYERDYLYGNLFSESLEAVMTSAGRRRAAADADARMAAHCSSCPYARRCRGVYVGDATPQQGRVLGEMGCPVRPLIAHIIARLEQAGLADRIARRAPAADNPAVATPL